MKKIRKSVLILALAFTMFIPNVLPVTSNVVVAEAATIKISNKKLELLVGESQKLTVRGTKKKITWKSSKKSVATVSSDGKVTAKAPGEAKITATVADKKFTCTVTVKEVPNKYLENAPFDAVEVKVGDISMVVPSDYYIELSDLEDGYYLTFTPSDTTLGSFIDINIHITGEEAIDYDILKEQYNETITKEFIQDLLALEFDPTPFELTTFNNSDFQTNLGYAFKTECIYTVDGYTYPISNYIYGLNIDDYNITMSTSDYEELGLDTIAQYIINSIVVTK